MYRHKHRPTIELVSLIESLPWYPLDFLGDVHNSFSIFVTFPFTRQGHSIDERGYKPAG